MKFYAIKEVKFQLCKFYEAGARYFPYLLDFKAFLDIIIKNLFLNFKG